MRAHFTDHVTARVGSSALPGRRSVSAQVSAARDGHKAGWHCGGEWYVMSAWEGPDLRRLSNMTRAGIRIRPREYSNIRILTSARHHVNKK